MTPPSSLPSATPTPSAPQPPLLPRRLLLSLLALAAGFALPLYQWARFALGSDLYSYTLLVPFVTAYLLATNRRQPTSPEGRPHLLLATLLGVAGLALFATYGLARASGSAFSPQDAASFTTLPFVLLIAALFAFTLRPAEFRRALFPLAFLLFMVPFPVALEHAVESFLQHGSAPPAYWLFQLVGTPVFREDLVFQLPGIRLQIAPECSGIRSTLVLFMTSLLAGHLFLRSPTLRAILALAVIPLALARNGLRVFTIGQLCVSVGPHMIDSAIHHRGGPIFFALSLIPFFILVFILLKTDRSAPKPASPTSQT